MLFWRLANIDLRYQMTNIINKIYLNKSFSAHRTINPTISNRNQQETCTIATHLEKEFCRILVILVEQLGREFR